MKNILNSKKEFYESKTKESELFWENQRTTI